MEEREGRRIGEKGRKREERDSVGWTDRDREEEKKKERSPALLY